MNEWGIPDWREKSAYGDYEGWTIERWRWEFYRRRDDLRADFDASVAAGDSNMNSFFNEGLSPSDRDFRACIDDPRRYGYLRLPNPRIGDIRQESLVPVYDSLTVSYSLGYGARPGAFYDPKAGSMEICDGQLGVRFDLDKPLKPQRDAAMRVLEREQMLKHGEVFRAMRTPNPKQKGQLSHTWLDYLRILDAAEEYDKGWKGACAVREFHQRYTDRTAGKKLYREANRLRENF